MIWLGCEYGFIRERTKKDYPLAIYVHCASHSMIPAESNSCKIQDIRNRRAVNGKCYTFF